MENFHLIQVKYLPPTNTKGARVKLTSYKLKESKTLPFDYSKNSIYDMAEAYLDNLGIPIVGMCEMKDGYGIIADAEDNIFQSIL